MKMNYLFDLDGTLVYSKVFILKIYTAAYEELDINISMFKEKIEYLSSHTLHQYLNYLGVDQGEVKAFEKQLSEKKKELFHDFIEELIPNNELLDFINSKSSQSFIVSNASRQTALSYKELLKIDIKDNKIYSRERLVEPKPSKNAYKGVILENSLDINDVVVYEDSLEGFNSARLAGISKINQVLFCNKTKNWSIKKWK